MAAPSALPRLTIEIISDPMALDLWLDTFITTSRPLQRHGRRLLRLQVELRGQLDRLDPSGNARRLLERYDDAIVHRGANLARELVAAAFDAGRRAEAPGDLLVQGRPRRSSR